MRHLLARNLGLAHALVALLAAVGVALAVASAWQADETRDALSPDLHSLAEEALLCHAAAIAYLIASVAIEWQLSRCWRGGETSPTPLQTVCVFVQGSVALGGVAVVLRGAVSRAWLAGLGPVLPITLTVAVLAVVLSLAGRWLCHERGPVPRDAVGSLGVLRWLRGLLVVTAIGWLVALAWLEARDLPTPTTPEPMALSRAAAVSSTATIARAPRILERSRSCL